MGEKVRGVLVRFRLVGRRDGRSCVSGGLGGRLWDFRRRTE